MRAAAPLAGLLAAGCAATSPLDLIPPQELLMIEAAERLQAEATIARPAPTADYTAQFRAALLAAGIEPPPADEAEASPPGEAVAGETVAMQTAPAPAASVVAPVAAEAPEAETTESAAPESAAPAAPTGPITVEEMLARVRARRSPAP